MSYEIDIKNLIHNGENTLVDFKRQHPACPVELVHDILCLANADGNSDRYCIYGVKDGVLEIVGVSQENRKTEEKIIDILTKIEFNSNIPEVTLKEYLINSKIIDVLTIRNSLNKPYYLRCDYSCSPQKHGSHKGATIERKGKGIILRANAIYTRVGSTNTPITGSASETQIQKMWEERLGLQHYQLERMKMFIHDVKGWKKIARHIEGRGENPPFYKKDPDFTLECNDDMEPTNDEFFGPWHLKNAVEMPYKIGVKRVSLLYRHTIIDVIDLMNVEHQMVVPFPQYFPLENVPTNSKGYISKSSLGFKIAAIINIGDDDDFNRLQAFTDRLNNFLSLNKSEFAIDIID